MYRGRTKIRSQGLSRFGRRRRRIPYKRRRSSVRNTAFRALKVAKNVQKTIKKSQQLKRKELEINSAVSYIHSYSLVHLGRGDTETTREGDQISMRTLAYKMALTLGPTETAGCVGRLVLVYDRRPAGTQAGWSDVMNTTNICGLIKTSVPAERGRYQILYDNMYNLSDVGRNVVVEKGFINLKGKKVVYDANAGDITDVQQGNLFWMFFITGDTTSANLELNNRLTFVDTT